MPNWICGSWRPDGWKNLYEIYYESIKDSDIVVANQIGMMGISYEQGATRFKDSITSSGKYFSPRRVIANERQDLGYLTTSVNGTLVFIPDDLK